MRALSAVIRGRRKCLGSEGRGALRDRHGGEGKTGGVCKLTLWLTSNLSCLCLCLRQSGLDYQANGIQLLETRKELIESLDQQAEKENKKERKERKKTCTHEMEIAKGCSLGKKKDQKKEASNSNYMSIPRGLPLTSPPLPDQAFQPVRKAQRITSNRVTTSLLSLTSPHAGICVSRSRAAKVSRDL